MSFFRNWGINFLLYLGVIGGVSLCIAIIAWTLTLPWPIGLATALVFVSAFVAAIVAAFEEWA